MESRLTVEKISGAVKGRDFLKILEVIPEPMMICDRNLQINFWNKQAEQLFGFGAEEVCGQTLTSILVPEQCTQELKYVLHQVFEKEKDVQGYETRRLTKSGGMIDVSASFIAMRDDLNEVNGMFVIYKDLKTGKTNGDAPVNAGSRDYHQSVMSLLLENTNSSMLLLRPVRNADCVIVDFDFLFTNSRVVKAVTENSKQYQTFLQAYPEIRNSELFDAYIEAFEKNKDYRGEFHVNFQGLDVWSQVYCKRVEGNLMVTYSDITKLKKAGQKISEQNRLITGVAETVPDFISVQELPGGKILYVNSDPFLINGYNNSRMKEMAEKSKHQVIHPEDQLVIELYYQSISKMKSDELATAEYRALNEEGAWSWFRARGRVFERDAAGVPISCVNVIQDISPSKRYEEELSKHLTLLKQAEEIAEIGSWEYDIHNDELKWSEGMFRLFNIEHGTKVSTGIYRQFCEQSDLGTAEKIIEQIRSGDGPFQYLLKLQSPGGPRIHKVKSTQITDEYGHPKKMLGIHVDITEQVKTEKALSEQMHVTGQITGASPDLIFIFDVNTLEIRYYTRTVADAVGYSKEQISTMKNIMMDVIHPDDHAVIHRCVEKVKKAADGEVVETEYRVVDPNGNIRWFRDRNTVFKRNEAGAVLEKIVFSHEITDEKNAENELRKSRERFDTAINMAPMLLTILTSIRDNEGKIVDFSYEFVSKSGNDMIGNNLTGSSMLTEYPEMRNTPVFGAFCETVETGSPCDISYQFSAEFNGPWVRWRAVKFDDGLFVSVEDITEKMRLESQALQNQLMQQKEILNAIILAQEQERERIGEALHNGVAQLLYVIQTRLQLLGTQSGDESKSIREILSIVSEAINDTRQISFELVPAVLKDYGIEVALKSLLQKILGVSPMMEIRLDLKQRLPEKTEYAIYRIVQELVNNIIKHSSATKAEVELLKKRKYIVLTVSDNGCGFGKDTMQNLNKGIGLQSVRNRVNLLEGHLKISSAPNKGTSIQIKLPI